MVGLGHITGVHIEPSSRTEFASADDSGFEGVELDGRILI
jgi:hypothetical protein